MKTEDAGFCLMFLFVCLHEFFFMNHQIIIIIIHNISCE